MLVKDLIHLLQTRGKPDDEVMLAAYKNHEDSVCELICELDTDFDIVTRDPEDEFTRIYLPADLFDAWDNHSHEEI